jgi:cysteine desulfurase / selenocysteine lyase
MPVEPRDGDGASGTGAPDITLIGRLVNEAYRGHAVEAAPPPPGDAAPLPSPGPGAEAVARQAYDTGFADAAAGRLLGGVRGLPFAAETLRGLLPEPGRPMLHGSPTAVPAPRLYFLPHGAPAEAGRAPVPAFDAHAVRRDFPALHQTVHGRPLVWLDNAATTQKPRHVIDAVTRFYERDNSNVHRTAHALAARATEAYEGARRTVQRYLGARAPEEIVFVRGTTEGINLVAQTFGRANVGRGDEIVVTELEHHANIVPWQMLAQETGAVLRVVPITDAGEVRLDAYEQLLARRPCLVALSHASNVLGTILPVELMTRMAHAHGARVLIDGAQSVPHFRVDVQAIGCDFYVFSGHKLFAPTGIGVLYGKADLLRAMPPWQGGGNMIASVSFEGTTFADIPHKFEAGTGILAGAVGLGAAIDYLDHLGYDALSRHEHGLLEHGTRALATVDGLRIIGTAPHKVAVLSFLLDGARPEDVAAHLDRAGIAVRAGHHCAQPTMRRFSVTGTVRASLAFYNTRDDVDALVAALREIPRRPRG